MQSKIYVVTHKPFILSQELLKKGYQLITVGDVECNEGVRDNQGINIASRNANYCELTAMYWIWKNSDAPYKGLCHYRRYFTNATLKYRESKILGLDEAVLQLRREKRSIIVPERKYLPISNKDLYLGCGFSKDLDILGDVIEEHCPEYTTGYERMLVRNNGYLTNMLIAPSDIFDEYCTWLFDILFTVEQRVNLSGYTKEEARIFGYMSERLLDVWLEQNHIHAIEIQSINPELDHGPRFLINRLAVRTGTYAMIKNVMRASKTR